MPDRGAVDRLRAQIRDLEQMLGELERTEGGQAARMAAIIQGLRAHEQQQLRAAEAIRRQAVVLQSILNSLGSGVIVADEAGRFLHFNAVAERIIGVGMADVPPEEWSGRYGCFLPDQVTPYPPGELPLARAIRGEEVDDVEVFIRNAVRPQGVWLSVNARPLRDKAGATLGGVVVLADVTERKRAERMQARQAEELARSNAELEQFAYIASHDLKEPLRMVGSFVQLLARRYRGRLDATADEFIGFAVDGVTRMEALIDDLLAYSRVGTRGLPFAPTDSTAALGHALANLSIAISESDAVVTHDALPVVPADAIQLTQLFQNLVGNAIKFRGAEPPRIHVSAERHGGEWAFAVSDNGIGLDPQHTEQIFRIFQRLHSRTEYPGTGIGLAICKRIVERHGGRIWVESQPGAGCVFRFTLPTEKGDPHD